MSPPTALDERFETAWQRKRHDVIGALEEAESLRDEATVHGDDLTLGRALTLIGACHLVRNDHAAAVRALLEAVELYEALADSGGQAFVLNRIGSTFYDDGNLDDAEHA